MKSLDSAPGIQVKDREILRGGGLHNTRASHVISRLEAVLKTSAPTLQRPAVVLVEESRHRIRYLPIGET